MTFHYGHLINLSSAIVRYSSNQFDFGSPNSILQSSLSYAPWHVRILISLSSVRAIHWMPSSEHWIRVWDGHDPGWCMLLNEPNHALKRFSLQVKLKQNGIAPVKFKYLLSFSRIQLLTFLENLLICYNIGLLEIPRILVSSRWTLSIILIPSIITH